MASTIEEPMPLRCLTFTNAENRLASPLKGKRHAGGKALSGLKSSVVVGGSHFRKERAVRVP
jgi:hypothetical protein